MHRYIVKGSPIEVGDMLLTSHIYSPSLFVSTFKFCS